MIVLRPVWMNVEAYKVKEDELIKESHGWTNYSHFYNHCKKKEWLEY